MIHIVVLLETNDADALQAFERQAVKLMKKYEGKLVTAFEPDASRSSSSNIAEIHILEFPNIEAFNQYRTDPHHRELSELRIKAISNTTVFVSGTHKYYEELNR
jgi:uncharacterized protein (DUF1330 family)